MRNNSPVTQIERDYAADQPLVSTTDSQGRITHCNAAFVEVSGFTYEELLGQPHSLVRHPDMPPEAFKDLWSTIGRGRPWSGIVKNRCKNGDHYWVHANVTPVLENGKPIGYMSVRLKPTREQVRDAESLYTRLRTGRETGQPTVRIHAGGVRRIGWRDWPYRIFRLSLSQRFAALVALLFGSTLAAALATDGADAHWLAPAAVLAVGCLAVGTWFHRSVSLRVARCTALSGQIAACDLSGHIDYDMRHPLGQLARNVWLTNLNMKAIVDDVRSEVQVIRVASEEIAQGSRMLSERSERQSANVQETASSVEEISSTVRATAATAEEVARVSGQAEAITRRSGDDVNQLVASMSRIEQASRRVQEVIQIIDGIAFQTNILSLNAAVEAARAGEHGKGFAVVATEVRALAHRAGEATKEIRSLIGSSVEEVSEGSKRVRTAEAVLEDIASSVQRVSELVRTITHATKEQSAGIGVINESIAGIDRETQDNAALSEQSAAACQVLEQRAGTLVRAVQIFMTRSDTSPTGTAAASYRRRPSRVV